MSNENVKDLLKEKQEEVGALVKRYVPPNIFTFDDLDAFTQADKRQQELHELFWEFLDISVNLIYSDLPPEEMIAKLNQLTADFTTRTGNIFNTNAAFQ